MKFVKTRASTRIVLKLRDYIESLWGWIKKTFTGENVLAGLIVLFVLSLFIALVFFAFYGMLFTLYFIQIGYI